MPKKFLILVLFILIGFSLYFFSFNNNFLLDDTSIFSDTSFFNQVPWSKIITTPYIPIEGRYYRPIATLIFKCEYVLFKNNLFLYHLLNLFLHIINSYLIFIFLLALFRNYNLFLISATLFLIHPFSAETVLTLIASSDMTAFTFFLLVLFFWTKDFDAKKYYFKVLIFLFFALALFTKETNLVLFPVLIYLDYCKRGLRSVIKSYRKYIPLFLVSGVFLFIRSLVLPFKEISYFKHISYYFLLRLIASIALYAKYLLQFLLPFNICPNIMTPISTSLISWQFIIAIIFLGIIIIIYSKAFKSKNLLMLFSLGYIGITILPTANITPLYPFLTIKKIPYLYHVPRHMYMPSLGIFIIMGYACLILVKYFKKKKIIPQLLVIPFVVIFCIGTVQKVSEYDNGIYFYSAITRLSPSNFWGHCYLAASYRREEMLKDAFREIKMALKLQPNHHDIHKKMADIYCDLGEYSLAMYQYKESIKINPNDYETYVNMGITYNSSDKFEKALEASYKAIAINPACSKAYANIGNVYHRMNKFPEAEESLQKAIELDPYNSEALNDLGNIYKKKEMYLTAIDNYERCLKIDPKLYTAYTNLSECYKMLNRIDKAIPVLKTYLQYFPDDPAAWNNLGICYASLKQAKEARECWGRASSYNDPISKIAKENLKRLLKN